MHSSSHRSVTKALQLAPDSDTLASAGGCAWKSPNGPKTEEIAEALGVCCRHGESSQRGNLDEVADSADMCVRKTGSYLRTVAGERGSTVFVQHEDRVRAASKAQVVFALCYGRKQ
jgi:hypothetical protein